MSKLKMLGIGLAVLLLIPVLGFTLHLTGVVTKVATTPSRVISKTLNTDNVISNYEWYYDVNASRNTRVNQIREFKRLIDAASQKEQGMLRMELAAIRQTCRDLSEKYNANSQKLTTKFFKDWNLPERLEMSDCE